MDLKQIEWFVRIVECGSMTRAAMELDVAQPALSRQIRNLERELGQPLLTRTGRGVRVTEAGRVLLDHGRGIRHQVSRLHEEIVRVHQGLVGRLAIGMPPSLSRALTVPLTREFYRAMPDARLVLAEGLSRAMLESVVNGDLDLALVFNPPASPELELTPMGRKPLYVVSAEGGPQVEKTVSLQRLATIPLVVPSRPNVVRMEIESRLAAICLKPDIRCEVNSIPGLLDLVGQGYGAAVLPRNSVDAFGEHQAWSLRRIVGPELAVTLYLVGSSRRPATQVQRNVVSLLDSLMGDGGGTIGAK